MSSRIRRGTRQTIQTGHRCCKSRFAPTMSLMPSATAAALAQSPALPDATGHFGPYGGVFVPETLVAALQQLEAEYRAARDDPSFPRDLDFYLREFVGRPSRLYFAKRLTEHLAGAQVYFLFKDLTNT